MKKFSTRDIAVRPNSIAKVAAKPPVTSRTLFETVAMREPPITVKVINAIFEGKCFIP